MRNVLVTGANGFLGYNVCRGMREYGLRVVGTSRSPEDGHSEAELWLRFELNGGDAHALLDQAASDVVVHAAACAARKDCASDPSYANRINAGAAAELAAACRERDIGFFFISTDLVFDGSAAPYAEDDMPAPASIYGASKAEAEGAVMAAHPDAYVLRCALIYGNDAAGNPASFLSWNVQHPLRGISISLYENQHRTPLFVDDVARAIRVLESTDAAPGIYHLGGPDRLSRMDIGIHLSRHYGFSPALIQSVALPETDDTSLRTDKIREACGMEFTSFEDGLRQLTASM
ncbi:sugar nucleotide-binding protein [bacterium]|nr:sugar nucleotide-binding protein [bacterium]